MSPSAERIDDADLARVHAAFNRAFSEMMAVWSRVVARYEFRGMLKDMNLQVELRYAEIVICADVPTYDGEDTVTLETTEKIRATDDSIDKVVYRALRRFLLHEAAECFLVEGKLIDDPHEFDPQVPPHVTPEDVEILEDKLKRAKAKLAETTL